MLRSPAALTKLSRLTGVLLEAEHAKGGLWPWLPSALTLGSDSFRQLKEGREAHPLRLRLLDVRWPARAGAGESCSVC